MVMLANFTSVFEVGFAINAILYLFDTAPRTENAIQRLFKFHDEVLEKKVEVTENYEAFPTTFYVTSSYTYWKAALILLSVLMSIASLSMLIWPAFDQQAELSTTWMVIILVCVLGVVPLGSLLLYGMMAAFVYRSIFMLEYQIDKVREERLQKQIEELTLATGHNRGCQKDDVGAKYSYCPNCMRVRCR